MELIIKEQPHQSLEDKCNSFTKVELNGEIQQLVNSNNQFFNMIAHDLRSPFSNVVGFLSLLKMNIGKDKEVENQEFVELALKSAQRAVSLLQELTSWAILKNGESIFNPKNVNLHDLLREEMELFYVLARNKQIEIVYTIDQKLCASADGLMVKTIMRNLINNALKFTQEGGRITISAELTDFAVWVSVKDTGVGIAESEFDRLFSDENYTTVGTNMEIGTGLGLKISKHFVDYHEGTIQLHSKVEEGSEFKFSLPQLLS